jgi:AraC-like DNA-binding protein
MAKHAGMSLFHFQRRFKAATGVTPRQFLETCRLEALKGELRGQSSATEAIYAAGFGSGSRVYERIDTRLGMTPVEYREGGKGVAISYVAVASALGRMMIGATDRGLCFVQFADSDEQLLEMLRREYPAALDQTWFQHFFDNVDPPGSVDVRPIDEWDPKAALGVEYSSGWTPGLVALIKADLIRKFPDVRVYAVPATLDGDGVRAPDTDAEPLSPTFVGTLQRGTNFYGFETLTEEEARGDDGGEGWFFVLEEAPRAMRFGLDRGQSQAKGTQPKSWANLAWAHLAQEAEAVPWFCSIDPPNDHIDDKAFDGLEWGDDAAVMAAITFRRPIQVFMHATAMLPEADDG